jgi:Ca2+-transporting ATPase
MAGLSPAEAQTRLEAEGYNELPQTGHRSLMRIGLDVLREPMFSLLIAAGAVYLLLGDLIEALMLLAFASGSVLITIVQESRSERVLEALRELTSPRALVIRGGERIRIPGREVVRGDFLVLGEGDRVAADAILLSASDLLIDESLLTGESNPVRKKAAEGQAMMARPGGDDLPSVFSGTLVVRGQGIAKVRATGAQSEIGRIGQSLSAIESAPARLSKETGRLVRVFAAIGLACCLAVVVLYGLSRGSWLEALLAGIALGMSMLPEEFPLVLAVFMVMGAWRISQARVLTRRASAIETLGEASVLCTDKTGTLTENRMNVTELAVAGESLKIEGFQNIERSGPFGRLAEHAALASAMVPFDPMEKAIFALIPRLSGHGGILGERVLVRTYGLRPDLLAMTQVWKIGDADPYKVAAKGALEAIAALCGLDAADLAPIREEAERMAGDGLRVLAVGEASFSGEDWPQSPRDFNFSFLGLVGLADPLRPSVRKAISECHGAGIRVIMITGDYPATAQAIARQAGLPADLAVTGEAIETMSETKLRETLRQACVFARILPAQKLAIVRGLKLDGQIVGMTGDGVNDAPSLKAADIGIAMGGRGSDVAREASSIVLLDDDFGSIVKTIRLGRRIYDNLRKAMGYIVALHLPIAGLALLPLLTGLPLILMPVHIAFLEMVINPVCAFVFEAEKEEESIMQRPPRAAGSALFSNSLILWSVFQGALAFAIVATIFAVAQGRMPETEVRALTFVSLVTTNFGLILVNRSFSSSLRGALRLNNPALWIVAVITTGLLAMILVVEPVRDLFRFGPLHADDFVITVAAGAGLVMILEFFKRFWRTRLTG